jgi:hypothetical protein
MTRASSPACKRQHRGACQIASSVLMHGHQLVPTELDRKPVRRFAPRKRTEPAIRTAFWDSDVRRIDLTPGSWLWACDAVLAFDVRGQRICRYSSASDMYICVLMWPVQAYNFWLSRFGVLCPMRWRLSSPATQCVEIFIATCQKDVVLHVIYVILSS